MSGETISVRDAYGPLSLQSFGLITLNLFEFIFEGNESLIGCYLLKQ